MSGFLSFQHRKLERDYEDALGNLKAERKACKAAEEGKADAERRVTELTNINAQLEASIKIRVRELYIFFVITEVKTLQ